MICQEVKPATTSADYAHRPPRWSARVWPSLGRGRRRSRRRNGLLLEQLIEPRRKRFDVECPAKKPVASVGRQLYGRTKQDEPQRTRRRREEMYKERLHSSSSLWELLRPRRSILVGKCALRVIGRSNDAACFGDSAGAIDGSRETVNADCLNCTHTAGTMGDISRLERFRVHPSG